MATETAARAKPMERDWSDVDAHLGLDAEPVEDYHMLLEEVGIERLISPQKTAVSFSGRVSLLLPQETKNLIDYQAGREDISFSEWVRRAIALQLQAEAASRRDAAA